MEVHQRRESLRLFGIGESSTADSDEDKKQVLVDFLEDKLGIAIAENLEFQRVHRIGKFSNSREIKADNHSFFTPLRPRTCDVKCKKN